MTPYLSIVMAACNHSDLEENQRLTQRYQQWVEAAGRLELELEIIVVQWNPPMAPRLNMVLPKPEPWPECVIARFIDVPREHHLALGLPATQAEQKLHALNVGIRRAQAPFIMTMAMDSQLHPALLQFFSDKALRSDCVYRTYPVTEFESLEDKDVTALDESTGEENWLFQTCEDFLLMPREVWFQQRGFAAIPQYSQYTAGLALYAAKMAGLRQVVLAGGIKREDRPMVHADGLDFERGFLAWCLQCHEFGVFGVNGPNWGLGHVTLTEVEEDRLPHGFR